MIGIENLNDDRESPNASASDRREPDGWSFAAEPQDHWGSSRALAMNVLDVKPSVIIGSSFVEIRSTNV